MKMPNSKQIIKAFMKAMMVIGGLLVLGAAVFAFKVFSREPLKAVPSTKHSTLSRESCIECHAPVADEWRQSFHHRSANGPYWKDVRELGYLRIFDATRKPCMNCHAPANVLDLPGSIPTGRGEKTLGVECTPNLLEDPEGEMPLLRTDEVDLGVDCVSCHVSARGIVGAGSRLSFAHETIADQRFQDPESTSAAFCITCHRSAVSAWQKSRLAAEGVTCLDCHMPLVRAPSVTGGVERLRRSHRFAADKDAQMLQNAVHASLEVTRDHQARLRILNDRVGHYLPSGGNWLLVFLRTQDSSGRTVSVHREIFGRDETLLLDFWPFNIDRRIAPGSYKDVQIALPQGHGKVQAIVRYWDWMKVVNTVSRFEQTF